MAPLDPSCLLEIFKAVFGNGFVDVFTKGGEIDRETMIQIQTKFLSEINWVFIQ